MKEKWAITDLDVQNGSQDTLFQSQEFEQDECGHFVGFQPHFHLNMMLQTQSYKTVKKWKCNISGVFCFICLKLCRLLELSKGISLHFKFGCYGNQNQNDCLLFKKQKVYCLSKCFSKNNLKQYISIVTASRICFWREIGDTLFLLWQKTDFCFWTKANYSHFSCQSNKIWKQAKFIRLFLTACKISNKSNKRFLRSCTFIFLKFCRIYCICDIDFNHIPPGGGGF